MASNEEGEEPVARGHEWEVVSLTASAYAASSGRKEGVSGPGVVGNLGRETEAETSSAMFLSGHFLFPPSEHENLPLEPAYNERRGEHNFPILISDEGKSDLKDEQNVSIEGLTPDEYPATPIFGEEGYISSVHGAGFDKNIGFGNKPSIYQSAEFSSIYSGSPIANNTAESQRTDDMAENIDHELDSSFQKLTKGDNNGDADLPCEAWWKRRAISLYIHAKEANTFWSFCIAAAVMGLAIIGHQWQQERWQILHLKWQSAIKDERLGVVLGQISQLKDVLIGGHRRGSLIRGSTSA